MSAKFFPIMGCDHRNPETSGFWIPWAFIGPHDRQAQINHRQTLERLARRGGLSTVEALQVVKGEGFVSCQLTWLEAKVELLARIETWKQESGRPSI